jgi:hypothetical protein
MSVTSSPGVNLDAVDQRFAAESTKYQTAQPFPHIAMQDVFDLDTLRAINAEFPSSHEMAGRFSGEIEGGKFTETNWAKFGPVTQSFIAACNSGPFLHSLSKLTGIDGLIADPYLSGGGQHQTGRGGRLKVHSDFNVHPFLNLTRRLNMLVYLNEGWQEEWGGSLELWDIDMTRAEVKIPPVMGQVAIFTTSDISFHGLPDPLECPDGTYRRSLAFYYFTADATTPEPRSTLWKERPNEDFLSRPSARIRTAAGHARRAVQSLFGR